jgi:hypothetical protein
MAINIILTEKVTVNQPEQVGHDHSYQFSLKKKTKTKKNNNTVFYS